MRKWLLIAVVLMLLIAAVCTAQRPTFGPQTVMVSMRDGVKLATDLYIDPRGGGPWPAVLLRTPYGKATSTGPARGIVRAGYVYVVQDMRGRFDSEGEDTPFLTDGAGELQDGYDTIEWLAGQEWCDGKVGMLGGSARGITQYLAAASAPPPLRCCRVGAAAPSIYHYAAYYGGVFRQQMAAGWLTGQKFRPECLALAKAHPSYDDLWRPVNLAEYAEQVNVAMVHQGGWFDCFQGGTIFAYETLQEHGGEGARGSQILVIGPGAHGTPDPEALKFPENSKEVPFPYWREFFGHYLKGEDAGIIEQGPRAYYYVMGAVGEEGAPGNFWRSADQWPPPSQQTAYYLHADKTFSEQEPAEENAGLSYEYDPANPVATIGGANLGLPKGSMDQRPAEQREDVLVFTTQPLADAMEVTGHLRAVLYISSDCPDTDFTAKLTDVYPDGRSMLIVDGIQRAKYRNSLETPELLEAGQVYRVEIDLWSTSLIFNSGHRIRVAISSSNYPRFSANPNTGAATDDGEEKRVASNTIYMSGQHASHVILPVVTGMRDWSRAGPRASPVNLALRLLPRSVQGR